MAKKITPNSGGWTKNFSSRDFSHSPKQLARDVRSLPWSSDQWRRTFADQICAKVLSQKQLSPDLTQSLRRAIVAIIDNETIAFRVSTTYARSLPEDVAVAARSRAIIASKDELPALWSQWSEALIKALNAVVAQAPPHAAQYAPLTAPFIDLLAKPADLLQQLVGDLLAFANDDPFSVRPGQVLAAQLRDALLKHSKLPDEAARRNPYRIVPPSEAGLPPGQLVAAYLGDTPLEPVFATPTPFSIPRRAFGEHGGLFAKSGHGKTQTLRSIVAGFLQEDDPPALFIIDSLGSLIRGIAQLDVFTSRLKNRLVILDPSDPDHLPSLNFFNLQSDDLCFYLFKAIDQSFTQRQATMISYLMELMRAIHRANIMTLIKVCESKHNLYPDALKKLSPFAQSFFENQFYAKKPDQLVQQTKSQIASRIYTLARMPKFDAMFSASTNPFDPYRCMQERKICLINTDARPARLGGLDAASAIVGRFILALCLDAARSRPENERHLALLVVDEAKHYMDEHAALILSDARQFGLGLLLATQFPHQLEEGVRRELNTNTSIKMMGPVEYAVASQYARDMFTTPEFIMAMKSYDRSHAEWATYVANVTQRAITLSVPFGAIDAMPTITRPRVARNSVDAERQANAEASPISHTTTSGQTLINPGKKNW